jgi:hypothetical protein
MDFLIYGVIGMGLLFILFLMWWSYLLGTYYERSLEKTIEEKF